MALKFAVQKPVGDVSVFKSTFHLDYSIRILEIWSVCHVPIEVLSYQRGIVLLGEATSIREYTMKGAWSSKQCLGR